MYQRQSYQQNQDQQKTAHRRTVDHGNIMGRYYIEKSRGLPSRQAIGKVEPEVSHMVDFLPPMAYRDKPAMGLHTKFVHLSANKAKHAIHSIKWTPEGRRILVASHSGEFTLWNGMTFNFETIMQAHDDAIFSLDYSPNGEWLLSADQEGTIKYWLPNFNNVNILPKAHNDGIRDLKFSPNSSKFVSCSDDATLKIWNFNNGVEERVFQGHHWDVKSCDWHSQLGLVVSGSKDNLMKLWDPRVSTCLSTLHGFKHTVTQTRFQPGGTKRLLAACSRDRSTRVFDLRMMQDIHVIRSHDADLSSLAWNPVHEGTFTTGGYDGSMNQYILGRALPVEEPSQDRPAVSTTLNNTSIDPAHSIPFAHEKSINSIDYHPLGHLLSTAGADRSVRFWSRARPNDPTAFKDSPYNNDKVGAWYYQVNNNVNGVAMSMPNMANEHVVNDEEDVDEDADDRKRDRTLPNGKGEMKNTLAGLSELPGLSGLFIPGLGR